MRYLGLSLGMAIVMGLCAAFGTLMPPIFNGTFASQVLGTLSGRVILFGIAACLVGIAIAGLAGIYKERSMSPAARRASIVEFDLKKGFVVALLSGVMSACFAYGLAAGDPMKVLTLKHGTPTLWQGLPVLTVLLIGGFVTNFVWCVVLHIKNKTGHEYLSAYARENPGTDHDQITSENALDAPSRRVAELSRQTQARSSVLAQQLPTVKRGVVRVPMLANY